MSNQRQDRRSSSKAHARAAAKDSRQGSSRNPAGPEEKGTRVRLTRKFAEMIDGVDLRSAAVGDQLQLSTHDAEVLIAEGWAEPARRASDVRSSAGDQQRRPSRRSRR